MGKAHAGWAVDDLGPGMVAFLRPCRGVEAAVPGLTIERFSRPSASASCPGY
jgi:hypothetical protein